jgi:RNA polymerase sigma-70 factor, ECF subfamily
MTAWTAHQREVRAWLVHQLGDISQAEDLLQDIFIKALANDQKFCEMANSRAWLYRVARNALTDHRRRHKPQAPLPEDLEAPQEELAALDALANCLPRVLVDLAPDDREVITLCDLNGLSQAAYARLKGLTLPGAKSRLQRARKRLRDQLATACQVRFDINGKVCCFVPRHGPGHAVALPVSRPAKDTPEAGRRET